MGEKAEHANPVVDAHKYDPFFGHGLTVINGYGTSAGAKSATMYPDDHRPFFIRCFGTCPNIQVKTVFADGLARHLEFFRPHHEWKGGRLHRAWTECCAFPYTFPRQHGLRLFPP